MECWHLEHYQLFKNRVQRVLQWCIVSIYMGEDVIKRMFELSRVLLNWLYLNKQMDNASLKRTLSLSFLPSGLNGKANSVNFVGHHFRPVVWSQ